MTSNVGMRSRLGVVGPSRYCAPPPANCTVNACVLCFMRFTNISLHRGGHTLGLVANEKSSSHVASNLPLPPSALQELCIDSGVCRSQTCRCYIHMYVYIELKHWELERHHCVVNLLARMWRAYLGNFSSGHHAKPNTHGAFPVSDNMWLTCGFPPNSNVPLNFTNSHLNTTTFKTY